METTNAEPTPIEALFLEAGLPVTEVPACPVPDCSFCADPLPQAA